MTVIPFPTSKNVSKGLFDEQRDALLVVDALLHASPVPLTAVTDRSSGAYALLYTGTLPMYSRARRSPDLPSEASIVEAGGYPLYSGKCLSFAERAYRHASNLRQVADLAPTEFLMVMVPTAGAAGAAYAEQLAIDVLAPVLNLVATGLGSRAQGPGRRRVQRRSRFDVLHPGRKTTGALPGAGPTREQLIAAVFAHLETTIPDCMMQPPAARRVWQGVVTAAASPRSDATNRSGRRPAPRPPSCSSGR